MGGLQLDGANIWNDVSPDVYFKGNNFATSEGLAEVCALLSGILVIIILIVFVVVIIIIIFKAHQHKACRH